MNKYIAVCGLDCEKCEARIATINDDNKLREKVAKEWSKLNGVMIIPEMINCVGCRLNGVKTPYCESLCPIRKCALKNNYSTCAECRSFLECEKLAAIINSNEEAKNNLK